MIYYKSSFNRLKIIELVRPGTYGCLLGTSGGKNPPLCSCSGVGDEDGNMKLILLSLQMPFLATLPN